MPTMTINGYRFRFYSSDIAEPSHMHVLRGEKEAKIWLEPIRVEYCHGYNRSELTTIVKLTQEHKIQLLEMWNEYFGS